MTLRPAVFLDRDGTVIEHVHYLSDPAKVRLLPGVVDALRRLQAAGFALVVITNQSAIGRGMITVDQYERVTDEMVRQLIDDGITLEGVYFCPVVPTLDDPTIVTHDDRKPGPGMLFRASRDLGLDLSSSWMIGDMISDVLAGVNAGCRGSFLVLTGKRPDDVARNWNPDSVVTDLSDAADLILRSTDDPTTSRGDAS